MIPFYVRPMSENDIFKAHELAFHNLDEYYSTDIFNLFLQQWPGGQYVAYRYDGKIAGFVCGIDLGPDRKGIALLAVEKENRNMGVGSKLLSTFRTCSAMCGAHTIQLEVRKENKDAIDFYEKRGFVVIEMLKSYYRNGGDAIRMMGPCIIDS